MKSCKRISFLVAIVVTAMVVYLFATRLPPEPVYKERPVSKWLDDIPSSAFSSSIFISRSLPAQAEAEKALKEIGPQAIPFIIRKLDENDSPSLNMYREAWAGSPKFLQKHLPKPKQIGFNASDAASAFSAIGTNAVPLLLPKIKDRNPAVREAVLNVLGNGFWKALSTNEAIAIFQKALSDREPTVRLYSALGLGRIGPAASNAVPALIAALQKKNSARDRFNSPVPTQTAMIGALENIGTAASTAVPTLTDMMTTGDQATRLRAAIALWHITSNANLSLPELIKETPTLGEGYKLIAAFTLRQMGPRAKPALPMLMKELANTRVGMARNEILAALAKIDPDGSETVFTNKAEQFSR
jgi:HEAT repeat protein